MREVRPSSSNRKQSPLTSPLENWINVPTNSILTIHNQTVMVHPIMDQYYDRNPQHRRSTAFVSTKGLSANEKCASQPGAPSLPQLVDHHHHLQEQPQRRLLGPTIPPSIVSSARTLDGFPSGSTSTVSTVVRGRTPLAHAEPAPSETPAPSAQGAGTLAPPDVRALTAPPLIRAGSSQTQAAPAQGNIKKKRASLSAVESTNTTVGLAYFDTSPVTPEPARTEFGNPNKIAQMFPELALQ